MSEKTKNLKSTLVRMRKVIAKKFRKLHDQKDERKRRFTEKYEPITNTLQKLIDSKKNKKKTPSEEIPSNRSDHHQDTSENSIQTDSDVGDNYDPEFDDEFAFDDYQSYGNEANNIDNENVNVHTQNQADETIPIHQILLENENAPGVMDLNDTTQTFTMDDDDVPMSVVASKRMRSDVDDDNNVIENERKRAKKTNSNKKSQPQITKTKKKWNELQYLKAVRRMALSKIKPINTRASIPSVDISPEDYDEDGNYRGAEKPKRRRIVTSSLRYMLVRPRAGRKTNKKRTAKKVAAKQTVAGEGLEREFIPYTENIVYQYWDNPNELCDRLKLLLASKTAENSNHEQEINSIIEELRERNIIM